ncbi:family 1 glycosylhydrolase, partial [Staphylococcus epidermidis]|uniref:family 1 glycosylhydrolase n=1 Tax=Staphylococcus epidermidis TaxID=1282 RepID=UPI0011A33334
TTHSDSIIYPQPLYHQIIPLLKHYPNYHNIYITQNPLPYKHLFHQKQKTLHHDAPIHYIKHHVTIVPHAIPHGANLNRYFLWAL